MAAPSPAQLPGTPTPAGDEAVSCSSCNGAGAIVMSLCCGRGCATCAGDGMMQAVECYRCRGRGVLERQLTNG